MEYSLSAARGRIDITVRGQQTKSEVVRLLDAIEALPEYPEATTALVRFESAEWDHMTTSDLTSLARGIDRLKPIRWAIVAPDDASFGMLRMF
jgi:hypothetical protein